MEEEQAKELIDRLRRLETETALVEFKVNKYDLETVGVRVSALSNSANLEGAKAAYLIFGVSDADHEIVGTSFNPNQMVKGQPYIFLLSNKLKPDVNFHLIEVDYGGKKVFVFEIPPAINQPVKYDGEAYIRIGEATPKLSQYPEKERAIWSNVQRMSFEKGVSKGNLSAAEVNDALDYSRFFELTKQDLPTETTLFPARMKDHSLVRLVVDGTYDITNLGAILFARKLDDFPSVKRKSVRVIVYKGNNRITRIKEKDFNAGYAVIFEELVSYINDQLPHNDEISRSFRREVKMYPEVAIREFVANSLIHQDLALTGAGPLIEIFDDRIEVTNPGKPLIEIQRLIDHPPRSRNEDLAAFMRLIGVCEESGTGIDRALGAVALFQLPAPLFETYENSMKVTLFSFKDLKDMSVEEKIRACFQHCILMYVENRRMTNSSVRERFGIPESNYPAASSIIRATLDKNLIKKFENRNEYIPHWV